MIQNLIIEDSTTQLLFHSFSLSVATHTHSFHVLFWLRCLQVENIKKVTTNKYENLSYKMPVN